MYRVRVELVVEDLGEMDSAIAALTEVVQQPDRLPYYNQMKSGDSKSEAQISIEEFDERTYKRPAPRALEEDVILH